MWYYFRNSRMPQDMIIFREIFRVKYLIIIQFKVIFRDFRIYLMYFLLISSVLRHVFRIKIYVFETYMHVNISIYIYVYTYKYSQQIVQLFDCFYRKWFDKRNFFLTIIWTLISSDMLNDIVE